MDVKWLKDASDNKFYPKTHESAVIDSSDVTLATKLTNINTALGGKEDSLNKVISLSSSSTDTQYPSAKCVYDMIGDIETLLAAI